MLSLLFSLEVQSGEPAEVFLAHSFVDGSAAPDSLTVIMRGVRPPISFRLHVTQDHVLYWCRQAWHLLDTQIFSVSINAYPDVVSLSKSNFTKQREQYTRAILPVCDIFQLQKLFFVHFNVAPGSR